YHLFGCVDDDTDDFVLTEEEAMESLLLLQQRKLDLPLLFAALARHSLLFLGCSFPDWFARFFIRILRSKPLLRTPGGAKYYVVGEKLKENTDLVAFLRKNDAHVLADTTCAAAA